MWVFKMYFQDDGEFFEYDPLGAQPIRKRPSPIWRVF